MQPDSATPAPGSVGTCQNVVSLDAPAKLNLSLAVGPRAADGYHPIKSLMVPLELADRLTLAPCPEGLQLAVSGPASAGVPTDRANLAWQASERLAESVGRQPQVRVELVKHIPAGGGLGGGSSDAAAVLLGLNRLWGLGLSWRELAPLAAGLGSDVPFCLWGEPAWVGGLGERVSPLEAPLPALWAVLVLPGMAVSTRRVYQRLDEQRAADPRIAGIIRRHRLAGLELLNELEGPALEVCPELARLFRQLDLSIGVPRLMVAGSGSTLFSLFDDPNEAHHWEDRIRVHLRCPASSVAVRRRPTAVQRDA